MKKSPLKHAGCAESAHKSISRLAFYRMFTARAVSNATTVKEMLA
jgi:hypothetical protein